MEAAALEEGTRVLAAEFLVTLCESRDKMLKKQPQLGQPFFSALLKFLLDIEVRHSPGMLSQSKGLEQQKQL